MRLPQKLQALGVVETACLEPSEIDEIWAFYRRFVAGDREAVLNEIRASHEVGRVRFLDGNLCAVWAISYVDLDIAAEHHRVIYTRLACADRAVRRHGLLRLGGLACLARQRAAVPRAQLHWFFAASTLNAYRMMARGLTEFYPTPEGDMPAPYRAMCDALGARLQGLDWNSDGAYVMRSRVRYREGSVGQSAVMDGDPLAQAYARLNPHQEQGDALMCICPLHADNARALLARASEDLVSPLRGVAGRVQRRASMGLVGPWRGGL